MSGSYSKPTKHDLLKVIESDRQSHISFLQKLIQAKSPNPPGDTREVAKVISDYLNERSVPHEILSLRDDLPNIVADFECDFREKAEESCDAGEEGWDLMPEVEPKRLVLNGHMDVFPVAEGDEKHWKHGPWSGYIDSKYIYGRGVVDMKAGTAAIVIAYCYLYELQKSHNSYQSRQPLIQESSLPAPILQNSQNTPSKSRNSLVLEVVSDEETGSEYGAKWLLSDTFKYGQEKSKWAGTLMLNPEPTGLNSIRFGEKGTLRLTFHITTISAHGAYTHLTPGAIRIATSLITSLLTLETIPFPIHLPENIREHMKRKKVKDVVDHIMGKGAFGILGKVTVNIGTIIGGTKVNVIPGQCKFEVDIRIPIGMETSLILNHITTSILPNFPSAKMEIQEVASNPPSFCQIDHPMIHIISKNTSEIRDEEPIPIYGIGATDSKFWRYRGVDAYSFGVSPESMAGRDERVGIGEFLDLIGVYVFSAREFLGGGD